MSLKVEITPQFPALAGIAVSGSVLLYTVALCDLTDVTLRMAPCPRDTVVSSGASGSALRVLERSTAPFVCPTVGSTRPGRAASGRG